MRSTFTSLQGSFKKSFHNTIIGQASFFQLRENLKALDISKGRYMNHFLAALTLLLIPSLAMGKYSNESEVSIIISGGNSKMEVYNFKTINTFEKEKNDFKLGGHYTLGSAEDVENTRNWDINGRFARYLSKKTSFYFGGQYEGDKFSGIDRRTNIDLGASYHFIKTEKKIFFIESGYRLSLENQSNGTKSNDSKGRVYLEGSRQANDKLFYKMWLELLPNFSTSKDYNIRFEPSLNFVLNSLLNFKFGLLGTYDNLPSGSAKKFDFLYTTSLIAKF